jgi:hypothetical protein
MRPSYLALAILLLGLGFSLLFMHLGGYTIREVTTTTTLYSTVTKYVTVTEQYPLASFPKLRNAKIITEEFSFNVPELWILDSVEDVTFRRGECTTLNSPLSVMMDFHNGTKRVTLLPSGMAVCPESILLETSEFSIRERPIPELHLEYWNPPPPKFIESSRPDYPSLAIMLLAWIAIIAGLIGIIYGLAKRTE